MTKKEQPRFPYRVSVDFDKETYRALHISKVDNRENMSDLIKRVVRKELKLKG